VGESPAETAIREAREQIGAEVRPTRLLDVLGGPDYEVIYPNGDRAAYVTVVYEADIIGGVPAIADDELSDIRWFSPVSSASLLWATCRGLYRKAAGSNPATPTR
jgi:8-oxo-dGTP pyrophosphatase MutT (NUDIX family)